MTESLWARLQRTGEGRILFLGLVLWLCLAAELVAIALWRPDVAVALSQGLGVEVFTGREAGIPVALQGGAPAWLVAQMSFTQDIAAVALAYPLFLWVLHRFHESENWFMRKLRQIEHAAERHEKFVHRWGPFGVFIFMLVPFLVNGPLVGAILGRLAGIHTKYLLLPVLGATAVAALAWTYAYDAAFKLVSSVDPRITPIATAAIVIGVFGWMLIEEARRERARKLE